MGKSPCGKLISIAGIDPRTGREYSHAGFVPFDLDEVPGLSAGAWAAVADARSALSRLDEIIQISGAPDLGSWMSVPLLRREAQSTSALEGTFEPMRNVLAADLDEDEPQSTAMREILNYVRAAEHCFASAGRRRHLTVGGICELQRMLVEGTPAGERDAGRVRTTPVVIGGRSDLFENARFVPMPPGPGLAASLAALVEWVREHAASSRDPVVEAALFHYQFETLHPFVDGNGRIGRMLIVGRLLRRGELRLPLLTVSPWLEQHDDEYRDRLYAVSALGDWPGWVEFFARAIRLSAIDVRKRIERVRETAERMARDTRGKRSGTLVERLPWLLVRSPMVSIASISRELRCSVPAATGAVLRLVELGHLKETTGRKYGRRYAAEEIVKALVSPIEPIH